MKPTFDDLRARQLRHTQDTARYVRRNRHYAGQRVAYWSALLDAAHREPHKHCLHDIHIMLLWQMEHAGL